MDSASAQAVILKENGNNYWRIKKM